MRFSMMSWRPPTIRKYVANASENSKGKATCAPHVKVKMYKKIKINIKKSDSIVGFFYFEFMSVMLYFQHVRNSTLS